MNQYIYKKACKSNKKKRFNPFQSRSQSPDFLSILRYPISSMVFCLESILCYRSANSIVKSPFFFNGLNRAQKGHNENRVALFNIEFFRTFHCTNNRVFFEVKRFFLIIKKKNSFKRYLFWTNMGGLFNQSFHQRKSK